METQADVNETAARLRRLERKLTGPRQAILGVLRQSRRPVSCQEVFSVLPRGQCNLATIYRCVRMLESAALVDRIDFGDGVSRYALSRGKDAHHHHLICRRCASAVEIQECVPSGLEAELTRRHGYVAVTHRLDFFGICPACQ